MGRSKPSRNITGGEGKWNNESIGLPWNNSTAKITPPSGPLRIGTLRTKRFDMATSVLRNNQGRKNGGNGGIGGKRGASRNKL
jgi:hypothetical protein